MIPGFASGKMISRIIVHGEAPTDTAASITPRSISLAADSTIRAKKGIAATESGTAAAVGPIIVPTNAFVNGIKNTSKIMNGIDLTRFVINPKNPRIKRFSKISPASVTYKMIPKGIPIKIAIKVAIPTMYNVSKNALFNSGNNSIIPMLYHLHTLHPFF